VPEEQRQIIAIGGLSPRSAEPFYRYILGQSPAGRPRVGFLPTASADSDAIIVRFYEAFSRLSCRPSHLPLFGRVADPAGFVRAQDVLLVGGGNTKSMLGLWREWRLDEALREAWQAGTVLSGFSAGAICWFSEALCDAWADRLAPVPALGLLSGSCCPHYDGEVERRPTYRRLVARGEMQPGLGIGDDCAVHFTGLEPTAVVAARRGASACVVAREADGVVEKALDVPRRDIRELRQGPAAGRGPPSSAHAACTPTSASGAPPSVVPEEDGRWP